MDFVGCSERGRAGGWPLVPQRRLGESNAQRLEFVVGQIERRLEVLRSWALEGVPVGETLPRSLNWVRSWDSPALGISRIGSSSSFTTTHPVHGGAVRQVVEVLERLARAHPRERDAPGSGGGARAKADRAKAASYKAMLSEAANTYVALSVELSDAKRDLRVTHQTLRSLEGENARQKEEIRELRRRLAHLSDREIVTDLSSAHPSARRHGADDDGL